MASSSWALQQAIHATLTSDASLLALLGSPRVYDDVPRGVTSPHVSFGVTSERDWSTGTEDGSEHIVTLHVWSKAAGRREAELVCEAIRTSLHDRPLTLAGHRLASLFHELTDIRRTPDNEMVHGVVRLRATTEPTA